MKTGYYKWLVDKAGIPSEYSVLAKFLSETRYGWELPSDSNRAEDGKDIRLRYYEETGERLDVSEDCTVLEMMVALADRMELDFVGIPGDMHPERWVKMMIINLGLSDMTNRRFKFDYAKSCLDDGYEAMFPLEGKHKKMPLWDRMAEFLDQYISERGILNDI